MRFGYIGNRLYNSGVRDDYQDLFMDLSAAMESLRKAVPAIAYNPLGYAWDCFSAFASMAYGEGQKVLFLGMNPGPDGMGQDGVPFGAVDKVSGYLGISGTVRHPDYEIPGCPVMGLEARRIEPSGRLFWGMAERFGDRDAFFSAATVYTYCPLLFLTEKGGNIALPELPRDALSMVEDACDAFFRRFLSISRPAAVIALGRYAESRARAAGLSPVYFQHPSPRNPHGRRFWEEEALGRFMEVLDDC